MANDKMTSYWAARREELCHSDGSTGLQKVSILSYAGDSCPEKRAAAKFVQEQEAFDCSFPVATGQEIDTVYVLKADECDRYDIEEFKKRAIVFEVSGETLPHYFVSKVVRGK